MKYLFLLLINICFVIILFGQKPMESIGLSTITFVAENLKNNPRNKKANFISHFGERFIFGTSYTYIKNTSSFDQLLKYREFTWNIDAAINLNSHWYVGISYKDIRTNGSSVFYNRNEKRNYFLVGVFTQYDFLPQKRYRLFAQLSGNYGNYCTCGFDDPYKKEDLYYLGFGLGFDYPILDWLSVDVAFNGYSLLEKIENAYTYTQYVIGLNIDLLRRKG